MSKKMLFYGLITLLIGFSPIIFAQPSSVMAGGGPKYAAPNTVGTGDCKSWANACTLQTALSFAISGNEIWVKAGVHYPGTTPSDTFSLKPSITVLGGFAGTETSRDQRNWQVNLTILSGDIGKNDFNSDGNFIAETPDDIIGDNAYHVVTGLAGTNTEPNTSRLDGFIITAGKAGSTESPDYYGGGMYNNTYANLSLTNLIFSGNWAQGGGGMYNKDNASPTLTNVTFTGNKATDVGGGGMYNGDSDPTLTEVAFINNETTYGGGGLYNKCGKPSLTNVIFIGNSANGGGGIANSEGGSPTLTNVIFSSNIANDNGGGMDNYMGSSPTLTNVTFNNNTAPNGGGMRNRDNSDPTLINVIMWGDSATNGPEIYNIEDSQANIAFSDIQGCGGSSAWNADFGIDSGNNIDTDPHFIDPAHGNLRLKSISPAIDAGYNFPIMGVTTDLDGNPRFVDILNIPDTGIGGPPTVDMGAYEAQAMINIYLPLVVK